MQQSKDTKSQKHFKSYHLTLFCPSDPKIPPNLSTNGSNGALSRNGKPPVASSNSLPRPLSPDSPEIIDELQRYAGGSREPPEKVTDSIKGNLPASGSVSRRHDAVATTVIQPLADAGGAQDLRTASKRKESLSADEHPSKQQRTSASRPLAGFPFPPGYGLPPLGINPAMMSHPLFMRAGSPYFQHSGGQLGDPGYMYPELFGPTHSSSSAATTTTTTSSSTTTASIKPASSVAAPPPPFMMSPSMAAMLQPGFPLSYGQSLASLYTGSMLPGGLPGQAATPGPGGASFLSHYQGASASSSCSSSPSSFSPSVRSEGQRGPVLMNGGNISSGSSNSGSSDDDDPAEVIEVSGQ